MQGISVQNDKFKTMSTLFILLFFIIILFIFFSGISVSQKSTKLLRDDWLIACVDFNTKTKVTIAWLLICNVGDLIKSSENY